MDKRASLGIATAALGAVAGIVLLRSGSGGEDARPARMEAVVGELDARVRETSAAVHARAVTLSQLPRLGWAVSTDPTTVRDLTADELAFRPLPGESIEIAQIQRKTGAALMLLRAPPHDALKLPVAETGQRLLVDGDRLFVVAVLAIDAHERGAEIRGAVAVAQRIELPTVVKRLDALRAHVRIETAEGALVLGAGPPPETAQGAPATLGSPAAQAAKVTVLAPAAGGSGGRPVAGVLVMVLGFAAAGVFWLRARRAGLEAEPPLPSGSRPASDRHKAPHAPEPVSTASDRRATPLIPLPTLEASGKRPALSPGAPPAAATNAAPVPMIVDEMSTTLTTLNADLARASDRNSLGVKGAHTPPEFRALFKEFVELRRTCGEATDGLDADKFVVVLGEKRAELMAKHAYKDVLFWVGFSDGKAVIRSRGIR